MDQHPRIKREYKAVQVMISLYCRGNHHTKKDQLCPDCETLLQYTEARLYRCPYEALKTTCAICPVHCYRPEMRQKIRTVMRYAGPRMIYHHPILTIYHLIDGLRKEPASLQKNS